jgi:hypothetical protein
VSNVCLSASAMDEVEQRKHTRWGVLCTRDLVMAPFGAARRVQEPCCQGTQYCSCADLQLFWAREAAAIGLYLAAGTPLHFSMSRAHPICGSLPASRYPSFSPVQRVVEWTCLEANVAVQDAITFNLFRLLLLERASVKYGPIAHCPEPLTPWLPPPAGFRGGC